MAIFGFIVSFIGLAWLSFMWLVLSAHGGLDLGPAPAKYVIPSFVVLVVTWYFLITNAPFTVTVSA